MAAVSVIPRLHENASKEAFTKKRPTWEFHLYFTEQATDFVGIRENENEGRESRWMACPHQFLISLQGKGIKSKDKNVGSGLLWKSP